MLFGDQRRLLPLLASWISFARSFIACSNALNILESNPIKSLGGIPVSKLIRAIK
jgi:hypothetical protein